MRGTALIINGTADHLHVLLRIRPAHSAAEIARVIKANASGWVRTKWRPNFAWQTGYGVFSVSESNVVAVTKYIASQEEQSQKAFLSGRAFGVPQEEQRDVRREIPLGLVSIAPPGLVGRYKGDPRLAPRAAFLRRFAARFTPVPRHRQNTVRFRTNPRYERDLVRNPGRR